MNAADFRLPRKIFIHSSKLDPRIFSVLLMVPDSFANCQGKHALYPVAVAFEHFAFTTLVIPSHYPDCLANIRYIVRSVKPRVICLVRNLVSRGLPVQFIPGHIWSAPQPDL